MAIEPAILTHWPIGVSAVKPWPSSGCSRSACSSAADACANTSATSWSLGPTYLLIRAGFTSAAAAMSRSDTPSTPRAAKSAAPAVSTARRTCSGPLGLPSGRLGPGRVLPGVDVTRPLNSFCLALAARASLSPYPRSHHCFSQTSTTPFARNLVDYATASPPNQLHRSRSSLGSTGAKLRKATESSPIPGKQTTTRRTSPVRLPTSPPSEDPIQEGLNSSATRGEPLAYPAPSEQARRPLGQQRARHSRAE